MNLKYYLRGLGVGIVVTALIMGISLGGKKESLSDKEIKARASELGMVEAGTTLKDNLPEKEEQQEEEQFPEQDQTKLSEETQEAKEQELEAQKPEEDAESQQENVQQPEEISFEEELREADASEEEASDQNTLSENVTATETEPVSTANKESITIEVKKGDGSYTVCKRLEEAGLIASAANFDTFLCENGYDKRIRAGAFEIPADADPEQIARILSGVE